jgi:hypothetical protein
MKRGPGRLLPGPSFPSRLEYQNLSSGGTARYGSVEDPHHGTETIGSMRLNYSIDEFGDQVNELANVNKLIKTGRQRKKLAARSKGGEFQQKKSILLLR